MKEIKIFLASSIEEFKYERLELGDYINGLNKIYKDKGIFISLEKCEDISNAIGLSRKQEEYNQAIRDSDMFYVIFGKEAGKYTIEEFDIAYEQFIKEHKPSIHTYFLKLSEDDNPASSVKDFITRLDQEIGHYYSVFSHIDSIKLNMLIELIRIKAVGGELEIKDGTAMINGKDVLSVENIPVYKNNENLQEMKKRQNKLRGEMANYAARFGSNPDDFDAYHKLSSIAKELGELSGEINGIESDILNLCSSIVERSEAGDGLTWREREAGKCIDEGNYEGALLILRDQNREKELKNAELHVEHGLEEIKGYIKEDCLRIDTLITQRINSDSSSEILECYRKCEELIKKYHVEITVLYDYSCFLYHQNKPKQATSVLEWVKKYYDLCPPKDNMDEIKVYAQLGNLYVWMGRGDEAKECFQYVRGICEEHIDNEAYKVQLANCYIGLGKLENGTNNQHDAKEFLSRAIEIFKNLKDINSESYGRYLPHAYFLLGIYYAEENNNMESISCLKKAIEFSRIYPESMDQDQEGSIAKYYTFLAEEYSKVGQFSLAEEVYNEGIDILEKLVNENPGAYDHILATLYYCITEYYLVRKQYNKAIETIDRCLWIINRFSEDFPDEIKHMISECYRRKGKALTMIGKDYEAEKLYISALEIEKEFYNQDSGKLDEFSALYHIELGKIYEKERRYKEALNEVYQAISILENLQNNKYYEGVIEAYQLMMLACKGLRFFDREKEIRQRLIELEENMPSDFKSGYGLNLAKDYYVLGTLCDEGNLTKEAQEAYLRVEELLSDITTENYTGNECEIAKFYSLVSWSSIYNNNPERAIKKCEKAIGIFESLSKERIIDYKDILAQDYTNVMFWHFNMKKEEKAIVYCTKAVAIYQEIYETNTFEYSQRILKLMQLLSSYYIDREQYVDALDVIKKTEGYFEQVVVDDRNKYIERSAAQCFELGINLYANERFDEAEVACKMSVKKFAYLCEEVGDDYQEELGLSHNNLAFLYLETDRYKEAAAEYKIALDILRPVGNQEDIDRIYDNLKRIPSNVE